MQRLKMFKEIPDDDDGDLTETLRNLDIVMVMHYVLCEPWNAYTN